MRLEAREPIYTQDLCKEEEEEEIHKQDLHIPIQLLEYQTDVRGCIKPISLLRPYIADMSALPMLELGFMPLVTTMTQACLEH